MATTKKSVPDNMLIYEAHREPPKEALKPINAGRLKGMSDINPMWRIKALTEEFGPCGVGWYYTIDKQWLEKCENEKETIAFVNISLYVKINGEWSMPIIGNGGSKFIAQEQRGPFVSDEAFKMAITDAIGVACKQLGIAADVYFANDRTKYTDPEQVSSNQRGNQAMAKQSSATNTNAQMKQQEDNGFDEVEQNKDPRLLVTSNNKMTGDQYAFLLSEIERTDSLKDVVAYAKTEDLTTLSSSKCVAILVGLNKRASKNK